MRICFVINRLIQMGPVVVMRDIIRGMQSSEWQIYVVSLRSEDPSISIQNEFESLSCKCVSFHCSLLDLELRTKHVAKRLQQFLSDNKIDILHTHTYHPDLVASNLPKGFIPVVTTLHNLCAEDYCYQKGFIQGKYMAFRHLKSLKRLNVFCAITECVARYYNRIGVECKVIYNGIDESKFGKPSDVDRLSLRRELGILPSAKVFIYCAGLVHRKNPLSLIRSFVRLLDAGQLSLDDRLIFLGKGPLEDKCKALVPSKYKAQIIFAGFQQDVVPFYLASDIGVSASLSEGFGLNVVEAVACGLPFVASDIPPHREILGKYHELESLLFEPGSDEALADALLEAYQKTESYPMGAISNDITSRFSAHKMSTNYQQVYRKMVEY